MLDKDEGHPGFGRKSANNFSAGLEASGRRAYSNDAKFVGLTRWRIEHLH